MLRNLFISAVAPGNNRKFIVLNSSLKRLEVLCSQLETSFTFEKCLVWTYVYLFQTNTWWQNEDCAQKGCVMVYFWYFFKVRIKNTLELLLLRLCNWRFFYFDLMQGRKEENACMQVIFKLRNNNENVCGEMKVSGVHLEIGHCFLFLKAFYGENWEITSWKICPLLVLLWL